MHWGSRYCDRHCDRQTGAGQSNHPFGKEVERIVNVDPAKLEVFMGKMIGHMTGSTLCYSIWLGDELGL